MKTFENIDAKSVNQAVTLLRKFQQEKKSALVVGGGSEILQLMKERVVTPDYVVNLKTIPGLNTIREDRGGLHIGALTTLVELGATFVNGRFVGIFAPRISIVCGRVDRSVIP